MADRLSMLAEEFRVYKIETDDIIAHALNRIEALEAVVTPTTASAVTTDLPAIPLAKKTDPAS